MINRHLKIAVPLLFIPAFAHANEHTHENHIEAKPLELLVDKTPSCECCKKWISHIEDEGITAHSNDFQEISRIKTKFEILPSYRSCHTAVSKNSFVFEGHVPAKFIKKFLAEKHDNAIGLSVPAMPVGSPGMEVGENFMPYNVLVLFEGGSNKVYKHVNGYEEQF
jgi:hypothetical protein